MREGEALAKAEKEEPDDVGREGGIPKGDSLAGACWERRHHAPMQARVREQKVKMS